MARYRPIHVSIWQDEDEFLNYSDAQKVMLFYLMTNENLTESGVYRLSPRLVGSVLSWPLKKVEETLKKLKPNAFWDAKNKVVFVKNTYKYNGAKRGRPSNIEQSIAKDCQEISTPLWSLFLRTYPKFAQCLPKFDQTFLDLDLDLNLDLDTDLGDRGCKGEGGQRDEYAYKRFPEFWGVYPKKSAKKKALEKYKAASRSVNEQAIIDGATRYATRCKVERTEERYIKSPDGWLSAGRWDDEVIINPATAQAQQRGYGRQEVSDEVIQENMRKAFGDEW